MITTVLFSIVMLSCSSDDSGTSIDISCEEAIEATLAAELAYDNATDTESAQKCIAYKAALETQIDVCGDTSGALQLVIDSLGNCSELTNPVTGSITANIGSAPRNFNQNLTVTTVGTTRKIYAEDSAGYHIEFDLAAGATGTSALQNFSFRFISSDFTPLAVSEGGNWTSNITLNSATKITGTFNGIVSSSSNAALEFTSGIININID